jgi:bile acid:Na+ symporter, BASS family
LATWPEASFEDCGMDVKQLIVFALQGSIFVTVFGFGLQATTDDVLYLVRRPSLLVRSLVAMFVVMPLLAVGLDWFFAFHRATEVALVALSLSPVPPMLPGREVKSGGRASYGVGLLATAGLFSIVYIPVTLELIGRLADRPFAISSTAVARLVFFSVLAPLAVGMVFRKLSGPLADRIAKRVQLAGMVLLGIGALAIAAAAFPAAWELVGNGTILVLATFVVVGLAVGHFLGGPELADRITLALSTACRHPAIALAIAGATFPDEKLVVGGVLLYLVLHVLAGVPYVALQRRATRAT